MRTFITHNGVKVLVGENARENDAIRQKGRQNNLWFHLEDEASSHVVLDTPESMATREQIHDCAQLCKYFSKLRNQRCASVIYIILKFVSDSGDKDGQVQLKKSPKTIQVYDDDDSIARLLATEERATIITKPRS